MFYNIVIFFAAYNGRLQECPGSLRAGLFSVPVIIDENLFNYVELE